MNKTFTVACLFVIATAIKINPLTMLAEVKQDYHHDENVEVTIEGLAETPVTILAEVNEIQVTMLAEDREDSHHDENVVEIIEDFAESPDTILAEVNDTQVTVLAEVRQDYHHDENVEVMIEVPQFP